MVTITLKDGKTIKATKAETMPDGSLKATVDGKTLTLTKDEWKAMQYGG